MPIVNPDPLRYPGAASTAGGTQTSPSASTDAASAWIQQQPWYRDTLAQWGNPKTLTLGQRGYLARTAQQAGLNKDFGIATDGTVEDWSTPTGAKIALAAMAAWAGGTGLGLLSNGSGATIPSTAPALEGVSAGGSGATSIPSAATSVLPDVGPSIAPASAASEAALPSASSLATAGGTLPDWLKTAKDVGGALQAYSGGRAAGRVSEGTAQQQQARTADELYNSQLNAPGKIAHNSVKGDILSRAQDVSIAAPSDIPVPTISGGLRPSMFSPTTRATGTALTQNASQDAANLRPAVPPTLPDLQGANGLDTTLNTAGLVGSLAKSIPTNIWSKILGAF